MREPINAWKKDGRGYFVEMAVGGKKDYSVDWTEFLPNEPIVDAQWSGPAQGVEFTDKAIAGKLAQAKIRALAAGEHECLLLLTTANITEPLPFRVLVK